MAILDVRSGSNDRGLTTGPHATFAAARTATTANAGVETADAKKAGNSFFVGPQYFVRRGAMEFNISAIPEGSIINSASLHFDFDGPSAGDDDDNNSVNLFHFTRASSAGGAFDANDFDEAAGTAACDAPVDITGLTAVHTFTLNSAAIVYLNSKIGGYAQFSLRTSGDYANSTPTGGNEITGKNGNDGTESNRPRLEVDFTPPSISGNPIFFSSGGVAVA